MGGVGIDMAAKGEVASYSARVKSGWGKGISRLTVVVHAPLSHPLEPPSAPLMTHKYRGSIVVLPISKSVEPNEEQKEMISGFQQGILCKY